MPGICENLLGSVNSFIYYAHQTYKINCLDQWISGLPSSFGIRWVGQCSLFYYVQKIHKIYRALPFSVDFRARDELWDPLVDTVHGTCSYICCKGHVNKSNVCKAQKYFYVSDL